MYYLKKKKIVVPHWFLVTNLQILIVFSYCALKQQTDLYMCALHGLGRGKVDLVNGEVRRMCVTPGKEVN